MICPIGGEAFEHISTGAYSVFGERPDGKQYGSWVSPLPLVECPSNGLIVFKQFSEAELNELSGLIATAEYRALRQNESPYYRLHWLRRHLSPTDGDATWHLLHASWESDEVPSRRARYQELFVTEVMQAPARPADLGWLALQARAINALRELGRFEEATALLSRLPREALAQPSGEEEVEEQRQSWRDYLTRIERVIARRDSSSEPFDMIPTMVAASYCVDGNYSSNALAVAFCESEEMREEIGEAREAASSIHELVRAADVGAGD